MEPLAPTRSPLFHNKHRYQKIGVHEVSASDGHQYTVLYLATGTRNPGTVLSFLPCCPGSHPTAVLILFDFAFALYWSLFTDMKKYRQVLVAWVGGSGCSYCSYLAKSFC